MKGDHDTASVAKAKYNDSNLLLTLSTVHPGKVNVGRVSPDAGSVDTFAVGRHGGCSGVIHASAPREQTHTAGNHCN